MKSPHESACALPSLADPWETDASRLFFAGPPSPIVAEKIGHSKRCTATEEQQRQ